MKKVKNVWLRCSAWLLNSILLLLGFSSCDSNGSEMYGTPYALFSKNIPDVIDDSQLILNFI